MAYLTLAFARNTKQIIHTMKRTQLTTIIIATLASNVLIADELSTLKDDPKSASPGSERASLYDTGRPDSHAPIGVMWDHTHHSEEWMLSYRYMYMEMGGYRSGTSELSSQDIFDRGFMVAPTGMEMHMHMLGVMYASFDTLTLSAMVNYQEKTMNHVTRPGSMARMLRGEQFTESVNGWGDLSLTGLYKIYDANEQRVHFSLGLSLPTGEFTDKAYPMQFTTGTWDLLPGITWLWQSERLSGGLQANGRIHLGENDEGFTYGDTLEVTTWTAFKINDWVSISGRLSAEHVGDISGEGRDLVGIRMAPSMDPDNWGGTFAEVGLGLNFLLGQGALKGNRLAVEFIAPIYQDVNGLQMEREWGLIAGWQFAF